MMRKKALKHSYHVKLLVLLALGTLTWSLTMIKSGLIYSFGMGFWGANGHDGIWHIALANSLGKFGLAMPVFSGNSIQNYHIGFDLLLSLLNIITTIPLHVLYFQVIPPILALSIGLLTYKFVKKITGSVLSSLWAVFFVYFGGSFGWLVTLMRSGEIGGESLFWSQQAISTLINPPFALSLVMILGGLLLLTSTKKSIKNIVLAGIIFGLLIEIKAYAGVLVLGGLIVSGLYEYLKSRETKVLKVFLVSLVTSIIIVVPLGVSSSVFIFQPFWFLETMMGVSDRFFWPRFYEAMLNYKSGYSLKAIPAYIVAFILFWYGNLGTRAIKELEIIRWIKNYKKLTPEKVFILAVIFGGILAPILFLQRGTPWNTIQFIYYSLFFSSIIAGIATATLLDKIKSNFRRILFSFSVVVLTIPTTVGTLRHYLPSRPPAMVSSEELSALKFLSNQEDGIVLTYPFDKQKADEAAKNPPRPLYLYESTAYVSAFSQKLIYLEDQVNLDITGFDWPKRREDTIMFYDSLDVNFVRDFLKKNNIKYIYWLKGQRAKLEKTQLGIERIFENKEVDIYVVK